MGLRFRKSISLGKGIRLNVGKTGVSISAGIPGFRKTIHSSGRVTTTVGVPGSGLYYVDTDHIGQKKRRSAEKQTYALAPEAAASQRSSAATQQKESVFPAAVREPKENAKIRPAPRFGHAEQPNTPEKTSAGEIIAPIVEPTTFLATSDDAKPSVSDLFENCDLPVSWIDVLANNEPISDDYDEKTWEYLHSKAIPVFEGDVEAMLQIIDEISPYDDLASYASDFKVEMEDPLELCVEFTVKKDIASRDELQDAVCSVVIRVVRDSFAVLPVERVIVHTNLDGDTIIAASLDRGTFASLDFAGRDASELLESFGASMKYSLPLGFRAVERIK